MPVTPTGYGHVRLTVTGTGRSRVHHEHGTALELLARG
jgi:hypothetical protein